MNKDAHILILEDVTTDAELIDHELRKANIAFTSKRVETKEAFLKALTEFQPDIVLSDHNLPQFSGREALHLLKETGRPVPFILITGSLSEEVAVEFMKDGAHDYILKTSLKRLPSAVINALEKAQSVQEKVYAEAALHRSEEQYRLIADNTSDLVCMIETNGNYIYVSPSHKELLGYAPYDLVGKSCYDFIHPDEREAVQNKCSEGRTIKKPKRLELRFRHSDGGWKLFETIHNWIYDSEGHVSKGILVSRDLTERKLAEKALRDSEEQLRQSQKLEAVGLLAGGVAHDFNNLLTVITGYSDLLIRRATSDDPNRVRLKEIKRAAERASDLTRQLLAFSRKQVLQPKLFNLNVLVAEMGKLLRRLIGEDVELEIILQKEVARINADPGQIEQVLMNLVVNARDAMPKGGKIIIETTDIQIDQGYARMHVAVQPGPYVMLAVSDNGNGMDAETKKHIFEPFFTTKEQGKGTGLGLSTVYGIVKQSGGNVWVYSELGQGTTFKVYLPAAVEDVKTEQSTTDIGTVATGHETILLVEDEEMVRELAKQILEESGYLVMVAKNGEEALHVCKDFKGQIDLMITDVVMPQMSGRELAERVDLLHSETKVLYMSGYTDDAIVRHGILGDKMLFLQKPFSPASFALKVREVLDLVHVVK